MAVYVERMEVPMDRAGSVRRSPRHRMSSNVPDHVEWYHVHDGNDVAGIVYVTGCHATLRTTRNEGLKSGDWASLA